MVFDPSTPICFTPCMHRRVVPVTTGSMHYSGGDVWEDIHEYLLCLDCMEYLTEAQIRARWCGAESPDPDAAPEEDEDVPF